MKLSDFLSDYDKYDEDMTLYVDSSCPKISGDTYVKLIEIPEEDDDMEVEGMVGVMDVWKVAEILQGKCLLNGIHKPTNNELVTFFIEYLEKGA